MFATLSATSSLYHRGYPAWNMEEARTSSPAWEKGGLRWNLMCFFRSRISWTIPKGHHWSTSCQNRGDFLDDSPTISMEKFIDNSLIGLTAVKCPIFDESYISPLSLANILVWRISSRSNPLFLRLFHDSCRNLLWFLRSRGIRTKPRQLCKV